VKYQDLKCMSKNNENILVPKLRFPIFSGKKWEETTLTQVADYENGKAHEQDIEDAGDFIVVNSKFISQDGEVKKFTNTAFCPATKGDVLMVLSDIPNGKAIAKCFVVKEANRYTVNQRICRITPYNLNSKILYYLLNRNAYFLAFNDGVKQTNLRKEDVLNCPLIIPSDPKEQEKISETLSSLEEVIITEYLKLEVLNEHKKGLLQHLFPQESETVPKLRFKEFEDNGEWGNTSLEKNCLVKGRIGYRGYTTEDLVSQGEGVLVLGGKHIQNQLLELKDPTYLSWEKYYESPEIMVKVGNIIFSQRGTLGDCAIIDREIGLATINPSMVLLKNITCDARFLYYILIGDRIQIEVLKNRAMGAIPMLSQKQIKEFPFLIPKNPKEQQKIAICLSSLDDLIITQSQKVEALKLHKKGLLQGLFPTLNNEA